MTTTTTERYRVWECRDDRAGDPVRWIAAKTEEEAQAAAAKRGWTRPSEIKPCPIPQDDKGLRQMGCDVIVRRKA